MSYDDLTYMLEQEIIQRKEEGCYVKDVELASYESQISQLARSTMEIAEKNLRRK